ncbi:helix-turn-helix transcriptional regulator [Nonomuraea sp. NN258]|uniref:ArsR/SmtB family transcription factor n=1 Tax=Nonomuraea antri TaxID=2730852 RepID=UPI00156A1151|nr:helix-turn-helix domain-containing protein [Nonomuraea antri]NRQ36610.1 helix-turn-helix transcriptional regulator [Nonomuraea antri]
MARREIRPVRDLETLKALGHPLRMRLYRALVVARRATASHLADQVDEAVSLVSYHLRKLAAHGLIEEAEQGSGDGRERWWQMAVGGVSTRDEDFRHAPESEAAYLAMSRMVARQRAEMYQTYLDAKSAWPDHWRDASFNSEYLMRLTPEEFGRFRAEMDDLLKKWEAHSDAAREAGDTEGRENVAVHTHGFPFRP